MSETWERFERLEDDLRHLRDRVIDLERDLEDRKTQEAIELEYRQEYGEDYR